MLSGEEVGVLGWVVRGSGRPILNDTYTVDSSVHTGQLDETNRS